MKKLIALGVNSTTQKCCTITSLATFDQLSQNYELYSKHISSTNWCGQDDIDRTCELEKVELTGRKVQVGPIKNQGVDYDCGHEYPWTFTFNELWEVEKIPDKLEDYMEEREINYLTNFAEEFNITSHTEEEKIANAVKEILGKHLGILSKPLDECVEFLVNRFEIYFKYKI